MTKPRKINSIERFLNGEKGQRLFNLAYYIGAAIVIWGALFKILHLPGGSTLLCIGMGTEIAMFILTAFDRPAKEYKWEHVFPELDRDHHHAGSDAEAAQEEDGEEAQEYPSGEFTGQGYDENGMPVDARGSVVIVGGGYAPGTTRITRNEEASEEADGEGVPQSAVVVQGAGSPGLNLAPEDTESLRDSIAKMANAAQQLSQMADLTLATQEYLSSIAGIAEQMSQLQQTTTELNKVSEVLLDSYKAITENSSSITESSSGYVESMADLNRNISGLNTIYEIQLKSISSQLESIDRVNRGLKDIKDMYEKSARQSSRYCEETERMTRYMTQLNSVYEKMVTAMTINMYNPMMGGQTPQQRPEFNPFEGSQANDAREENYDNR